MTPSERAAAEAALAGGRPIHARLDQIRGPEDAAADILDLWTAAEAAMRAMLGGSTLSGQALVRELRQRGLLDLEQANAIASFWDAKTRVEDVGYKPTLTDVGFARVGYNELGLAINNAPATAVSSTASTASTTSTFAPRAGAAGVPFGGPTASPTRDAAGAPGVVAAPPGAPAAARIPPVVERRPAPRMSRSVLAGLLALAIIVVAVIAYVFMGNGNSGYDREMAAAVQMMQAGNPEAARAAFSKITRDYPDKSEPHVFLARLARDDSPPDTKTATQELVTAIRLDPSDERAQREMGILLLTQNNPDLARSFLARAAKLSPTDSAAQGYLGCALLRLNRVAEGQTFLSRAGPGVWSTCNAVPAATTPPIRGP